jgi:hypothetical protein
MWSAPHWDDDEDVGSVAAEPPPKQHGQLPNSTHGSQRLGGEPPVVDDDTSATGAHDLEGTAY